MSEWSNLIFYGLCAVFITHELDAVHKREWRLLFVLRTMKDKAARRAFILLHVPLATLIIWLLTQNGPVGFWSKVALDLFAIIHAALHFRLSNHPTYEFNTFDSQLFIYGAAFLGCLHLALLLLF